MAPRKEPVVIERRTISGRGVFIFTPEAKWRHFWLYVSILRPPAIDFGSSQYNPDRSFYATFVWSHRNYILREDVLRYYQQCFEWASDPTGYIAKAETCLHDRTIEYLQALGDGLSVPLPVPDPNNRIWYEPLQGRFDRIRIVCRDRTAITAELWGLEYDVSCPSATPTPKLPPVPDLPPPSVPPNQPLDDTPTPASPPYPQNDGGDTVSLPGDQDTPPPQFPVGNPCQQVRVDGEVFFVPNNAWLPFSARVWGPVVEGVRQVSNSVRLPTCFSVNANRPIQIQVRARGIVASGCGCQANPDWCQLTGGAAGTITGFRNVTYTPL